MAQQGFQLDLNLCTGCQACVVACAIENELPWDASWRSIETFNAERLPGLPLHHLSLACNHCTDAPCAVHCPALAYDRDPRTGAVLLDAAKCIGCKYCTWACPYDAPSYDAAAGVVSKCTFCNHRQLEGLDPACVTQCPTSALRSGPLESLEGSGVVPGFPRTDAGASIRFVPLRGPAPEQAATGDLLPATSRKISKVTLRSEFPLLVFSLLCALLVGIMSTATGRAALPLEIFVAGAAFAASSSSLHLGRKERAWRAVLNWRRSWLSREILLFGLFAALGTVHQMAGIFLPWLGPVVAASGFALLFAIDRVYDVTATRGLRWHSAGALLSGLLVAGIAGDQPLLWGVAAFFKLVTFLARRRHRFGGGEALRLGALLLGSGLLTAELSAAGILVLALGEVLDRAAFYRELEITTPRVQAQADWLVAKAALEGAD